MIKGLAYVTVGCEWREGGFLTHYGVPSSEKKWLVTKNKPLSHDVVAEIRTSLVPIRLIRHDTGLVLIRTRISIRGKDYIVVMARDPEKELGFLSVLGMRGGRSIKIGEKTKLSVFLDISAPVDPPLDAMGCTSIAVYSSDLEHDVTQLMDAGGRDYTGQFHVQLGGETRKTALLRSPEGTLIELVEMIV